MSLNEKWEELKSLKIELELPSNVKMPRKGIYLKETDEILDGLKSLMFGNETKK